MCPLNVPRAKRARVLVALRERRKATAVVKVGQGARCDGAGNQGLAADLANAGAANKVVELLQRVECIQVGVASSINVAPSDDEHRKRVAMEVSMEVHMPGNTQTRVATTPRSNSHASVRVHAWN